METRQGSDDVAVLLVQMLERGIFVEDIHPLPLRKNHPDGAVLEYQPCFTLQEDGHLLVQTQLDKIMRQPLI